MLSLYILFHARGGLAHDAPRISAAHACCQESSRYFRLIWGFSLGSEVWGHAWNRLETEMTRPHRLEPVTMVLCMYGVLLLGAIVLLHWLGALKP